MELLVCQNSLLMILLVCFRSLYKKGMIICCSFLTLLGLSQITQHFSPIVHLYWTIFTLVVTLYSPPPWLHLILQKSCREKFAAKLNPALEGLNTSACEQAWIWLNDLAMNMKHMNMYNFRIYLHSAVSTHNALVESRGGIVTPLLLEGEKILIGTKVCAKFRNNFWYCGSVIKITDQRVRVLFVDQDTRVLSPHVHMRLCKHDPQLRKSPE